MHIPYELDIVDIEDTLVSSDVIGDAVRVVFIDGVEIKTVERKKR